MTIGDCKEGDIVWVIDNLSLNPVQVEVCDDCTSTEFLMPRKSIRKITTIPYPFVDLFYTQECYKTKEEVDAEIESRKHIDVSNTFFITKRILRDMEYDDMKNFIKHLEETGVISNTEYKDFKKEESAKRFKMMQYRDEAIDEFINHGRDKQG